LSGTHENPAADTVAICESFGYEAFIVQRGEKIAALPAITALGRNMSWGTDIESRNALAALAAPRCRVPLLGLALLSASRGNRVQLANNVLSRNVTLNQRADLGVEIDHLFT
jgi:hypothetical protein